MSGSRRPNDSIRYPESPADLGRSASNKPDPAEFARQLASHAGFDALRREDTPPPTYATPPPTYSRLVQQPRLTLVIPDHAMESEDATASTPITAVISDSVAIESVDSSPIELPEQSSSAFSLTSRFRTKLRKRSIGLRERIRWSNGSSRSSSAATSPSEGPSRVYELDTAEASDLHTPGLSVIQELDGQPIPADSSSASHSPWASRVRPHERHVARNISNVEFYSQASSKEASSIVPTPHRGLSFKPHVRRSSPVTSVDAADLSGRLQSLHDEQSHDQPEAEVSPCSPTWSRRALSGGHTALARSNAVTNSIAPHHDLVSPVGPSLLDPPVTPTLDGRLDRLPRLATPVGNSARLNEHILRRRQSVAETDSGKELVSSLLNMSGRLHQPVNLPQWDNRATGMSRRTLPSSQVERARPGMWSSDHSPQTASPRSAEAMGGSQATVIPQPSPRHIAESSVETATSGLVTKVMGIIRSCYGPEPQTPAGHVRVRWRCRCGEDLYDDFVERRPGAAAELEAHLNKAHSSPVYSAHSSHPTSAVDSVFSPTDAQSPLSPITEWPSPVSATPYKEESHELTRQTSQFRARRSFVSVDRPYFMPLWLYTCINEGSWSIRLRHLDVNKSRVSSDRDLAIALSKIYSKNNKSWTNNFKIRGLSSVKLVEFDIHRNRLVDIVPASNASDMGQAFERGYEFEPSELHPPVGKNYLTHLFRHPEDFNDELIAYSRLPKSRTRLDIGRGWGLEFVEAMLQQRLRSALLAICLFGCIVFMVACMCNTGSDLLRPLKTAGVSAALGTLSLACAQLAIE